MSPPRQSRPGPEALQRIAKLLARAGVASRREVERMVAEGRVALDGAALTTPATLLASLAGVTVDGRPVEAPALARLFLYNKPPGLLVTERDPGGRPTIYDRLPGGLPRVVPVGRLDLATEGLLLLTTDGGLKRQLELPATGVERVYRARAYGQVTQAMLEELITGVEIEGVRYGPIDANLERRTGANVWIEMKLTEGKNREVRRVLDYLGLSVSRLIRTRYGPFALGELAPGAVAEVREHDIASFRKNPTRLDLPQPPRRPSPRPTPVLAPATGRGRPAPAADAPPPRAAMPDRRRPTPAGPATGRGRAASAGDASTPPRAPVPDRGGRPARPAAKPPAGADRSSRAARGAVEAGPIAKPARAARARAFREATAEPDDAGGRKPVVRPTGRPAGPARGDAGRPAQGATRRPAAGPRTPRPPRRPGR